MHGQFVIILGIPDTSRSFLSDFSLLGFDDLCKCSLSEYWLRDKNVRARERRARVLNHVALDRGISPVSEFRRNSRRASPVK